MADTETLLLVDYLGRSVRLTPERQNHILEHPEMVGQLTRIRETLLAPEAVIATKADETVHVYHRHYARTPVTSKLLLVTVKILADDAFVLTAFFSSRQKRGVIIWQV